eukprot:TRINITY_DN11143_c0_g1_i1.p1 TRINITY_DN11143_c0_g1~~TRINITY_DN11143_c0_g1_i1.p1  ORF type:complete len:1190 (-),score=166.91 TRINITY_DN11143_c0_g1_i1:76-3645(-)
MHCVAPTLQPLGVSGTQSVHVGCTTVLTVGQVVQARWRGGVYWYPGRITQVNSNGTYAVQYDSGPFEPCVPLSFVRSGNAPTGVAAPVPVNACAGGTVASTMVSYASGAVPKPTMPTSGVISPVAMSSQPVASVPSAVVHSSPSRPPLLESIASARARGSLPLPAGQVQRPVSIDQQSSVPGSGSLRPPKPPLPVPPPLIASRNSSKPLVDRHGVDGQVSMRADAARTSVAVEVVSCTPRQSAVEEVKAENERGAEDEEEEQEWSGSEDEGPGRVGVAKEVAANLWGQLGRWTAKKLSQVKEGLERVDVSSANMSDAPKTDSHLNSVSIEYKEEDILEGTKNFDKSLLLGTGAFGCVYKGAMRDGTEVAVKVLEIPDMAGFEDEVKVLSRFRHPNLVCLIGFARHKGSGHRSLVYEFLAGGDVSGRILKSRRGTQGFSAMMRLSAALDAASGLSHLHNATPRAFHRDIKCPNILLDRNGTAKMADFGLACVSQNTYQKVAASSGTPGYVCPEYLRTGFVTEGSEVHSFGMCVLEMLTGRPPAVVKQADKPKELEYLIVRLLDRAAKTATAQIETFKDRVVEMIDRSAEWPVHTAHALSEMCFKCVAVASIERPRFVTLVEEIRSLLYPPAPPAKEQAASSLVPGLVVSATPPHAPVAVPEPPEPPEDQEHLRRQVCDLYCTDADGVDLDTLAENQRTIILPLFGGELVVGRSSQNPLFWETLVKEDRYSRTISREHFRIVRRSERPNDSDDGEQQVTLSTFLTCLSPNGLTLNNVLLHAASGERRLFHGDTISLVAATESSKARFLSFTLRSRGDRSGGGGVGIALPCHAKQDSSSEKGVIPLLPSVAGPSGRTTSSEIDAGVLCCIFSDGVSLEKLNTERRCIKLLMTEGVDFIVGRIGPCSNVWNDLVPQERFRGMISREHISITMRHGTLYLACLSPNGAILNEEFLHPLSGDRQLKEGDVVQFLTAATSGADSGTIARKPLVTFSFWPRSDDEDIAQELCPSLVLPLSEKALSTVAAGTFRLPPTGFDTLGTNSLLVGAVGVGRCVGGVGIGGRGGSGDGRMSCDANNNAVGTSAGAGYLGVLGDADFGTSVSSRDGRSVSSGGGVGGAVTSEALPSTFSLDLTAKIAAEESACRRLLPEDDDDPGLGSAMVVAESCKGGGLGSVSAGGVAGVLKLPMQFEFEDT